MPVKVGDLVEATVVRVGEADALVQWEGGGGILPLDEAPEGLHEGQRLILKVIALREDGVPVLSQRQVNESDRELFFLQRETRRLQRVLRERRIRPTDKSQEKSIEDELARWIDGAERTVERLRRRRRRAGLGG